MKGILSKEWEARLAKHGLSNRQLDDKDILSMPVSASESGGIQNHQFDGSMEFQHWLYTAESQIDEEELRRYHEVPVKIYHRNTPAWALSNKSLRYILMTLFPKMASDRRQRKRAARTCSLIYRYFRLCEPAGSIAEDLCVSAKCVQKQVERIKHRAIALGI